jgi:hypothetical protein
MNLLEQSAGTGEEASARLTMMYRSLGTSLEERLEQLAGAGDSEAATKAGPLLAGFESFLEGVAQRDPKAAAQLWVATTYQSLGSGTNAAVPRAKAGQYLDRAATAYGRLLARMGQEGLPEAEAAELRRCEPAVRLKIASLSRERGKWDAAREQIDALLADPQRQNWLEAQIEAAELLVAAGRAAKNAGDAATADTMLREAAAGRKTGIVIWGWGGHRQQGVATGLRRYRRQGVAGPGVVLPGAAQGGRVAHAPGGTDERCQREDQAAGDCRNVDLDDPQTLSRSRGYRDAAAV